MKHFSLFTGTSGLDLAAEMAGFRTVGQIEIGQMVIEGMRGEDSP
jgi:site-specific DNA-cytosine methylase